MTPEIRKIVIQLEEIHQEMAQAVDKPTSKVTVAAVIKNPFSGKYVEDLNELKELGKHISSQLTERGVKALDIDPGDVESYGKGAIIGVDGEIEHAAALLHPRFGAPMRAAVVEGKDIIPSTKKIGGPGAVIVMPLTHKNSIWEFDHMDAAEITIPDAPKPDEIVVAIVLGVGGRPLARTKPD
ncbi:MAG: amino acid synthesis family protein [Gammaproteobacteria bacterium]|nr:amino acid synthesis family protein [Gammaproteobacteria bacterium]